MYPDVALLSGRGRNDVTYPGSTPGCFMTHRFITLLLVSTIFVVANGQQKYEVVLNDAPQ